MNLFNDCTDAEFEAAELAADALFAELMVAPPEAVSLVIYESAFRVALEQIRAESTKQ